MISDVTEHQLNGIHREITKTMQALKRKKELGRPIKSEVQRLEKFAVEHGASKDWNYNSDNLKDVEALLWSAYNRLRMDIDGYAGCETPEQKKRVEEMADFYSGDHSTEKLEPKTMEDARRMISQTDDPTAIMEIIGTQDHLDRLELIKENWDKVGGQYRT